MPRAVRLAHLSRLIWKETEGMRLQGRREKPLLSVVISWKQPLFLQIFLRTSDVCSLYFSHFIERNPSLIIILAILVYRRALHLPTIECSHETW